MHETRTIASGFHFPEGPRWHDGALWFSDMHGYAVLRATLDGEVTTVTKFPDDRPSGLGWLADGRLLFVAMESQRLMRIEPDESVAVHADLSSLARGSLNDMIVAADGTAYVGDMGMRLFRESGQPRPPGQTIRVTPDGEASCAADDLQAPNGHVLTDDGRTLIVAESAASRLTAFDVRDDGTLDHRRTFAELAPAGAMTAPPDGICLDAEGAVWAAELLGHRVLRLREGGKVSDSIELDDGVAVACVLGGEDRRTLLMCVADDFRHEVVTARRSGRIEACEVAVPGAGRP
jgi:sugar lactone lactonase YvrE